MAPIIRRFITVSVVFTAVSLLLATAPLWVPLAWLTDTIKGGTLLRGIAFFLWLSLMEAMGIIVLLFIALARPFVGKPRFQTATFKLQCWWVKNIWAGACVLFRVKTEVEDQHLLEKAPYIFAPRHCSTADVMLPGLLASAKYGVRLRYVLKSELLWDPCLDIAGHNTPNIFVNRESGNTDRELEQIRQGMANMQPNEGALIYPEGTRFSIERQRKIRDRLAQKLSANHPSLQLKNVLPARPAGLFTIIDSVPKADVVFMAHYGFEGFRDIGQLVNGSALDTTCRCKIWRIPASDIPADDESRKEWLEQHWAMMDQYVGTFAEQANA